MFEKKLKTEECLELVFDPDEDLCMKNVCLLCKGSLETGAIMPTDMPEWFVHVDCAENYGGRKFV